MLKKYMKTISAAALAAGIVFATGAAPATAVLADELTQFDQTKIEDDLKDVDLTIYMRRRTLPRMRAFAATILRVSSFGSQAMRMQLMNFR